jgi:hypothetical protein
MKTTNEYSELTGRLYAKTPKAVFAALAVSFLTRLGENGGNLPTPEAVQQQLLDEWQILHDNGIVQQQPPKKV